MRRTLLALANPFYLLFAFLAVAEPYVVDRGNAFPTFMVDHAGYGEAGDHDVAEEGRWLQPVQLGMKFAAPAVGAQILIGTDAELSPLG